MDNNNYVPSAYPPSYSAAVLPDNVSVGEYLNPCIALIYTEFNV